MTAREALPGDADGELRAPLPLGVSEDVRAPLEFVLEREHLAVSGCDPLPVEPVAPAAAA
ncbi:hypothetical protein [Pseudonocardia xishanensis]|uniref:Uncharacterized protein n=1 Tax=Pseudonocardia xishanensis TaxID=630995 RepID=A0ABP8S3I5_9PSEU